MRVNGEDLISGEKLKILGFTLGRRPTMRPHYESILTKYAARTHVIRHLKKVDLANQTLANIFCSMVRPIIEYAAQIYHHMLSDELSQEIEKMQRDVFKTIYGFETSYADALALSGLITLEKRREQLALNFALSVEKNPKYSDWFPPHPEYAYNVRKEKIPRTICLERQTSKKPHI